MKKGKDTPLPKGIIPDVRELENITAGSKQKDSPIIRVDLPKHIGNLAEIATQAWKASLKLGKDNQEDPARLMRHIEAILDRFKEMGFEIKDYTGKTFDYGMPVKVVTSEKKPGITKERVQETLKPTIYWNNKIIQKGEVIINTPETETKP